MLTQMVEGRNWLTCIRLFTRTVDTSVVLQVFENNPEREKRTRCVSFFFH